MKQEILILFSRLEYAESAYISLAEHGISAMIVVDERDALSALITYPPAFLWIDLDIEAARLFLAKVTTKFLHPPPYIILASSFSGSADRAVMFDCGADACVEIPVDLSEILSILNAALRREERMRYLHTATLPGDCGSIRSDSEYLLCGHRGCCFLF